MRIAGGPGSSSDFSKALSCSADVKIFYPETQYNSLIFDALIQMAELYEDHKGDAKNALKYFINLTPENMKQQQEDCEKVREDYFEPMTQEGVNRFLDTY